MEKVLVFAGEPTRDFVLFSMPHIVALLIVLFLIVMVYINRKKMAVYEKQWRIVIGVFIVFQEVVLHINRVFMGVWTIEESLPLHMCSLSVFLIAYMYATRSYKMFEVMYFWGIAGALQAILTPNLDHYGPPHFRFYQFFVGHGTIMIATFFMIFVVGFLPTFKSLFKAMLFTNAILPIIGVINWLTGGNYFFIARVPETKSIIDMMGPWPYYILVLELVAFVMFALSYIPVFVYRITHKKTNESKNIKAVEL